MTISALQLGPFGARADRLGIELEGEASQVGG